MSPVFSWSSLCAMVVFLPLTFIRGGGLQGEYQVACREGRIQREMRATGNLTRRILPIAAVATVTAICGLAAGALALPAPGGPAAAPPAESPKVHVEPGLLAGVLEGGVRIFRGIPFAAPPV